MRHKHGTISNMHKHAIEKKKIYRIYELMPRQVPKQAPFTEEATDLKRNQQ